jgi:type VI secretion system secreted protein VgrG
MSDLFAVDLDLISPQADLAFDQIVGEGVTVAVHTSAGDRHFHGIVSMFGLTNTSEDHSRYRAQLVPKLWLLTRTTDCRIFQN